MIKGAGGVKPFLQLLCRKAGDDVFLRGLNAYEANEGKANGLEKIEEFGADAEYGPVHDWAEDPQGTALSDASKGRPDLHKWLVDRAEKYDELLSEWAEKLGGRGAALSGEPDPSSAKHSLRVDADKEARR